MEIFDGMWIDFSSSGFSAREPRSQIKGVSIPFNIKILYKRARAPVRAILCGSWARGAQVQIARPFPNPHPPAGQPGNDVPKAYLKFQLFQLFGVFR